MRAWAPCLSSSNLTVDSLLASIDNLNVISLPSPALQVMNLAGSVLGTVPHHWAQLAGTGSQLGAQIGTKVVSKTRTETFLKEVNVGVFLPRRLRVKMVKGDDVPGLLRMNEGQSIVDGAWDEPLLEKVLENVQPYSAQLIRQDLPVPESQTGLLDKWSAKSLEKEKAKNAKALKEHEKELEKEEKRMRKEERKQERRDKKHNKHGKWTSNDVPNFEDSAFLRKQQGSEK
jgi:hypothetical protein